MAGLSFVGEFLSRSLVARLVLYYLLLGVLLLLLSVVLPAGARNSIAEVLEYLGAVGQPIAGPADLLTQSRIMLPAGQSALAAVIAVLAAFLLALPLAWTYTWTRRTRGFQQSVVHSLVLLPVAVAGVVVLVKNNIALAFSLAGIVAAVRFRNTLDDSKDAVFIFFAAVLGLAAGVQLGTAAVLSMLFIGVSLSLWYTDFARTPQGFEGERARKRLDRATSMANRTSQFVAQLDKEVLDNLAPAQLDALSKRVERRRFEASDGAPEGGRYTVRVVFAVSDEDGARAGIERGLEEECKLWKFDARESGHGGVVTLTYLVVPRKNRTADDVARGAKTQGAPYVASAAHSIIETA